MKKVMPLFLILFLIFLAGCGAESTSVEITTDATTLTETTTEAATEPQTYTAKITAVGDLMMHSYQMDSSYNKATDTYSFDYSFKKVYNYLQSSDLTLGNLETVFAGKEIGYSDYPCFNSPEEFGYAIKNAGFDVLSTVNNHSMDKGKTGVLNTIDFLDNLGIDHFGTYNSQKSSENIFIENVNNIKIAFVGWTYGVNGINIPDSYLVKLLNEENIIKDLERAKALNPDVIIAMPHMGNEYEEFTRDTFKEKISLMVEHGADIVLASHPHVLQQMEFVEAGGNKAFVIYSLGNFISSQRDKPRDAGVILNIYISKTEGQDFEFDKISYIPTWVQWRDSSGNYNIRVLSVYDAIKSYEGDNSYMLRPKDYNRLKEVIAHSCKILTGEETDYTMVKKEYIFYNKTETPSTEEGQKEVQ